MSCMPCMHRCHAMHDAMRISHSSADTPLIFCIVGGGPLIVVASDAHDLPRRGIGVILCSWKLSSMASPDDDTPIASMLSSDDDSPLPRLSASSVLRCSHDPLSSFSESDTSSGHDPPSSSDDDTMSLYTCMPSVHAYLYAYILAYIYIYIFFTDDTILVNLVVSPRICASAARCQCGRSFPRVWRRTSMRLVVPLLDDPAAAEPADERQCTQAEDHPDH